MTGSSVVVKLKTDHKLLKYLREMLPTRTTISSDGQWQYRNILSVCGTSPVRRTYGQTSGAGPVILVERTGI